MDKLTLTVRLTEQELALLHLILYEEMVVEDKNKPRYIMLANIKDALVRAKVMVINLS
jgi:hypothetical protein